MREWPGERSPGALFLSFPEERIPSGSQHATPGSSTSQDYACRGMDGPGSDKISYRCLLMRPEA